MSHGQTPTGRLYVECDEPVACDPATPERARCGRRSFGTRDAAQWRTTCVERGWEVNDELGLFDIPPGWSVAPYPDDFDHGVTRRNILDGTPMLPVATLVGVVGDLHTCPSCKRRAGR